MVSSTLKALLLPWINEVSCTSIASFYILQAYQAHPLARQISASLCHFIPGQDALRSNVLTGGSQLREILEMAHTPHPNFKTIYGPYFDPTANGILQRLDEPGTWGIVMYILTGPGSIFVQRTKGGEYGGACLGERYSCQS